MRLTLTVLLIAGLYFSCGKTNFPAYPDTIKGSAYPNICQTDNGFIMIWYEGDNEIVMSEFNGNDWSIKDTIVSSERFFKNWADLPQIYHAGGDTFAVSWLEMSDEGTFDYDIKVAMSTNRGKSWTDPVVPHQDGIKGEHGFVSFFGFGKQTGLIWLDARAMMAGDQGTMRLYASTINPVGELGLEIMLDNMVCECCPTTAVNTSVGPLVAYRDRDNDETRNIRLTFVNGAHPSVPIHDDGWIIPGCPVNGPVLAANGEQVAIAWYTAPDNNSKVNIAFSHDGGLTFSDPIRIDNGSPIGRTDVVWLNNETILVSWLEEGTDTGELIIKSVNVDGRSKKVKSINVNSSRGSGYPKLAITGDFIFITWTEPGVDGGIRSEWIRTSKLVEW
ncbi:MAG: exo-alpha-sialidase [Candidatus Marinimicrobia bacterium]|nr:exo-alpha-sialidase [Candidatus Neomarinimicrobiota bacterium]